MHEYILNRSMIVQKIISAQNHYQNSIHFKTSSFKNDKARNNSPLFTRLKKVMNINIPFRKPSYGNGLQKNDINRANPFSNRSRTPVIDSKTVKNFISKQLSELNLRGNAKEDPEYFSQAFDAVLASVYSNKKDKFCKEMISKGIDISSYLMEAGEAAKKAGIKGEMKNDIFVPKGAGANPFITPLMSSTQKEHLYSLKNEKQSQLFRMHAEKIISNEVGEMCKEKGLIHPTEFDLILEGIGAKYLKV